MIDLTTHWLGLELKNPLVHSASPLSNSLDSMKQLEDAGVSAIVMYSLFEEQIRHESHEIDHYLNTGAHISAEASSYFPEMSTYRVGPDEYLEKIHLARRELDIPVIASLNGVSRGGWVEYARLMQDAGAHALELNIYMIPTDPAMTGTEVEQKVIDTVQAVRAEVTIPLAVKVGPYFSAMANMARRLEATGANGLVLFNRFYQPDFDLETLSVTPHLVLSSSQELRLPLRWVAILYGRVSLDLGITSGVHTAEDMIKGIMAGASVTMVTSALLRDGAGAARDMLVEAAQWMEDRGYESVAQMCGSMSQKHCAEPAAFERANYMRVLHSWRPDPTGKLTG